MAEKEEIFSSKISYTGLFSFKDFYNFCYEWLTDENNLIVLEKKYEEKLKGDTKVVEVKWEGTEKVTDYFKFEVAVDFRITNMKEVEVVEGNTKIKTNQGKMDVKVKGTLIRDYQGKFEQSASKKFLRSIYDKWVVPSRIEEYEDKLIGNCNEFLNQAKAYLDLEAKR